MNPSALTEILRRVPLDMLEREVVRRRAEGAKAAATTERLAAAALKRQMRAEAARQRAEAERREAEAAIEHQLRSNPLFPFFAAAATAWEVSVADIFSRSRRTPVAHARHAALALAKEALPGASLPTLAAAAGRDCHCTIIHSVRRAAALRASDPAFAQAYQTAKSLLQ